MPRKSTAKDRLTDAALRMIWGNSYGATSVDAICEQAGVKKGSFYYFYKSKSHLAAAALDADWKRRRVHLDGMFSPTVPPLGGLSVTLNSITSVCLLSKRSAAPFWGARCILSAARFAPRIRRFAADQEILDRKITLFRIGDSGRACPRPNRGARCESQSPDAVHVHPGRADPGSHSKQCRYFAGHLSRRSRPLGRGKDCIISVNYDFFFLNNRRPVKYKSGV